MTARVSAQLGGQVGASPGLLSVPRLLFSRLEHGEGPHRLGWLLRGRSLSSGRRAAPMAVNWAKVAWPKVPFS